MARWRRWIGTLALGVAAVAAHAGAVGAQAVITNGTIRMGIRQFGELNTGSVPQVTGGTVVGLRLITAAGEYESTADGCDCEGWGVGVRSGGTVTSAGYANASTDGVVNLTSVGFASTGSTATSTVRLTSGAPLTIIHEYRPSATSPYLYEVNVTITNTGAAALDDIVYRRVMDWDIAPTQFNEFVTLQGWGAANLIGSGNDGFASARPLSGDCLIGGVGAVCNGNFTTTAETDQGSFFDFSFGTLAAGASRTFQTFYGAAPSRGELFAALGAAGVEVYTSAWCGGGSAGTSPTSCNGIDGPAVFAYGFKGVGGFVPPELPGGSVVPEPSTYALMAAGLAGLAVGARRRRHRA